MNDNYSSRDANQAPFDWTPPVERDPAPAAPTQAAPTDVTVTNYGDAVDNMAVPRVSEQDERASLTDIVQMLREYADNPGFSHNDYADTMRDAAATIEGLRAQFYHYDLFKSGVTSGAPAAQGSGVQETVTGKPPLPPADQHTAIGARLFLVSTLCNYGTECFTAGERYAERRAAHPAPSAAPDPERVKESIGQYRQGYRHGLADGRAEIGAAPSQPRRITEATAKEYMEETLWAFIECAGNFPKIEVDERIWPHVFVYAKTAEMAQVTQKGESNG